MSDFWVLFNQNTIVNLTALLEAVTVIVIELLQDFAVDSHFLAQLELAFGSRIDQVKAQTLQHQLTTGKFALPKIEICLAADLNGAYGIYDPKTRTVYLAAEFLVGNAQLSEHIVAVVLEELGNDWEAQLNSSYYTGNRGKVFSAIVRGEALDEVTVIILRAESAAAKIWLAGQWVNLVMATNIRALSP